MTDARENTLMYCMGVIATINPILNQKQDKRMSPAVKIPKMLISVFSLLVCFVMEITVNVIAQKVYMIDKNMIIFQFAQNVSRVIPYWANQRHLVIESDRLHFF